MAGQDLTIDIVSWVTLAVAFIAAAFETRLFIKEQKRRNPVNIGFRTWPTRDEKKFTVKVMNSGREPARVLEIFTIGFAVVQNVEQIQESWFLTSREAISFSAFTLDSDEAWVLVVWAPDNDKRETWVEWFPFKPSNDGEGRWSASFERSKVRWFARRLYWTPWFKKQLAVRRVGPDNFQWAKIRSTKPKFIREVLDVHLDNVEDVCIQRFSEHATYGLAGWVDPYYREIIAPNVRRV